MGKTHLNRGDAGGAVQMSKPHESPEISETTEEIKDIFIKVYDHTQTINTDQTGKFPVRSSRGQQYMVVAHHVDSNWTLIDDRPSHRGGAHWGSTQNTGQNEIAGHRAQRPSLGQ